ncbi:MAG: hypothetical protein LBG83_04850 [Oscillospiraceae bacterium]|nr:hypothetical protein [Oscillospiraceae bacterium]
MKILKNRKIVILISVLLLLTIVMSATFAWITSQTYAINKIKSDGYGVGSAAVPWEVFPNDPLNIGTSVDKKVGATNTGSSPILVRLTFQELARTLANDGQEVERAEAAINGTATDTYGKHPSEADLIPVPQDGAPYTAAGSGYIKLTAAAGAPAPNTYDPNGITVPAGVEIYKSDAGDSFVALYPYKAWNSATSAADIDKYQAMKLEGTWNDTDDILTLTSAPSFLYFTQGTWAEAQWNAKNNLKDTDASLNNAWKVKGGTQTPDTTIPAALADTKNSQIGSVELKYTDANIAAAPAPADQWYYNPTDGYFYYLARLDATKSTVGLLEGLTLPGSATNAYLSHEYELAVIVEGIQATEEAVTDAAGWNISDATLAGVLKGLCVN